MAKAKPHRAMCYQRTEWRHFTIPAKHLRAWNIARDRVKSLPHDFHGHFDTSDPHNPRMTFDLIDMLACAWLDGLAMGAFNGVTLNKPRPQDGGEGEKGGE